MREIKFRAWDEGNKVLHKDVEFIRSGTNRNDWIIFKSDRQKLGDKKVFDNPYFSQQIKLMQYTGLLDKDGVEIYEGDIVCNEGFKEEVTWNEFYGWIVSEEQILGEVNFARIKVIGNIYENGDLLEI